MLVWLLRSLNAPTAKVSTEIETELPNASPPESLLDALIYDSCFQDGALITKVLTVSVLLTFPIESVTLIVQSL